MAKAKSTSMKVSKVKPYKTKSGTKVKSYTRVVKKK